LSSFAVATSEPWYSCLGKMPSQGYVTGRCAMMSKLSRVREQRWI